MRYNSITHFTILDRFQTFFSKLSNIDIRKLKEVEYKIFDYFKIKINLYKYSQRIIDEGSIKKENMRNYLRLTLRVSHN